MEDKRDRRDWSILPGVEVPVGIDPNQIVERWKAAVEDRDCLIEAIRKMQAKMEAAPMDPAIGESRPHIDDVWDLVTLANRIEADE